MCARICEGNAAVVMQMMQLVCKCWLLLVETSGLFKWVGSGRVGSGRVGSGWVRAGQGKAGQGLIES